MRPSDAARALAALIPTRRPAYLWGPPGSGKSSVVRAVAAGLGLPLVDVRATLLDPVDLRGLPRLDGDAATWCPPAFLPRGGDGVLFLDELAQAPPLVQAACLQLVLGRRVGRALAYRPAFVTGLTPDELAGVLCHEVMHCALAHPGRRGGRDPGRWNVACDLAVNPVLLAAGLALPPCRLLPGDGAYAQLPSGKSAEEYYALLGPPPAPPEDGGEPPGDPGGCGGVTDPAAVDPAAVRRAEADWSAAVARAEQVGRTRGVLPAGLGRTVGAVLRPPADWRAVLREFVSAAARNDYSWARPNRRLLALGLYLPGLHSEELGDVVVAVDTSGSVGPAELGLFAAELDALLSAFDCTATVLYHDAAVQTVETWSPADGPFVLSPVGGGGTDHRCVFDWLDRSGLAPACVVCLTDLATVFPVAPPAAPVLWAVVGDDSPVPPFGRVVRLAPVPARSGGTP